MYVEYYDENKWSTATGSVIIKSIKPICNNTNRYDQKNCEEVVLVGESGNSSPETTTRSSPLSSVISPPDISLQKIRSSKMLSIRFGKISVSKNPGNRLIPLAKDSSKSHWNKTDDFVSLTRAGALYSLAIETSKAASYGMLEQLGEKGEDSLSDKTEELKKRRMEHYKKMFQAKADLAASRSYKSLEAGSGGSIQESRTWHFKGYDR